jgi:hypothetical protein
MARYRFNLSTVVNENSAQCIRCTSTSSCTSARMNISPWQNNNRYDGSVPRLRVRMHYYNMHNARRKFKISSTRRWWVEKDINARNTAALTDP